MDVFENGKQILDDELLRDSWYAYDEKVIGYRTQQVVCNASNVIVAQFIVNQHNSVLESDDATSSEAV